MVLSRISIGQKTIDVHFARQTRGRGATTTYTLPFATVWDSEFHGFSSDEGKIQAHLREVVRSTVERVCGGDETGRCSCAVLHRRDVVLTCISARTLADSQLATART
jgi:hypothetical protein